MYLQDNTGRLLKEMAAATNDLDTLFAELDTNLAQSRQIFSQVAASDDATATDTAHVSNAALASRSIHAAAVQDGVHNAVTELQVPAYVHVGDPLVTYQPKMASAVCSHQVHW